MPDRLTLVDRICDRMTRIETSYNKVKTETTLTEEERERKLDSAITAMVAADMEADERLYHRNSVWYEDGRY